MSTMRPALLLSLAFNSWSYVALSQELLPCTEPYACNYLEEGDCDFSCLGDIDDDNDGVVDWEDSAPLDPFVCSDIDSDGCDDCSSGLFDPMNDGDDTDGDGLCDDGDIDMDGDGVVNDSDSAPLDPFVCADVDMDGCDDCGGYGFSEDFDSFDDSVWHPSVGLSYTYSGGSLFVQGDGNVGAVMQRTDDFYSVTTILGSIYRDQDCDDHVLMLSTDASQDFYWGQEISGLRLAWNCSDQVELNEYGFSECAGTYGEIEFTLSVSATEFYLTTSCGLEATVPNPTGDNSFFIYVGADQDAGGGAEWQYFELNGGGGLNDPLNDGPDSDGDGICDFSDDDSDNDGVPDSDDWSPNDPSQCSDVDEDGCDDCISGTFNPSDDGFDTDGDGLCDSGDPDDDNDGVTDESDSDPFNAYSCSDVDEDGCDDCSQGFFDITNDGLDVDGDGLCSGEDSDDTNPYVCGDVDGDGCDDCSSGSFDPMNDGEDTDGDGLCNGFDVDDDNDGVVDWEDSAPLDPFVCSDIDSDGCDDCSSGLFDPMNDGDDTDGDGLCDDGDIDMDGDGVVNDSDSAPLDPFVCADVDMDGCDDCGGYGFSEDFDSFDDSVWHPSVGLSYTYSGGSLFVQGDGNVGAVMQRTDDFYSVTTILGSIYRDQDCDDHVLMLSTDASQDFYWGQEISGLRLAWNCSDQVELNEYGFSECAGTYGEIEFTLSVSATEFYLTTSCGLEATVPNPTGDNSFFIYVGADQDAGGGAEWQYFELNGGGGLNDPLNDGPDSDGDGICDFSDDDSDNDGVPDSDDWSPNDPSQCSDVDEDGCDDCISGTFNPSDDGFDTDGDGLCDSGDPDDDNDGVTDESDSDPFNAYSCSDVDEDGCDDCSQGFFDITNDGLDVDGDGLCSGEDSDDTNPYVCGDVDGDGCDDCSSGSFDPMNDGEDTDGDGLCNGPSPCDLIDTCGVCDGPGPVFECGCYDVPEGNCDCDGSQLDALGVCGGGCASDFDGDGICDDEDECIGEIDACGVCNGEGEIFECGCMAVPLGDCDCYGNQLDAAGVCGGDCVEDEDNDGICDDEDECVGEIDACGVCNGEGEIFECGCTTVPVGDCDCSGGQLDALGVCGGSCLEDLDSDGVCDDIDECIGAIDECGVCNGLGSIYECGCIDIPDGDCDCEGNQLDAAGICGGDCELDANFNGLCDDLEEVILNFCGPGTYWSEAFALCLPENTCYDDLDGNGSVGMGDLLWLLSSFGTYCD